MSIEDEDVKTKVHSFVFFIDYLRWRNSYLIPWKQQSYGYASTNHFLSFSGTAGGGQENSLHVSSITIS